MFSQQVGKVVEDCKENKEASPITQLPMDLIHYQRQYLSFKDARALIHTCRLFASAYQKDLNCDILLHYVAHGDQSGAEKMLRHDPGLLLRLGSVKDCANNVFENITALQYAFWALDKHMIVMLLRYIPPAIAMQQLENFQAKRNMQDLHYDFSNLTNALDLYINEFATADEAKRESLWCNGVGGAQKKVPAHVAQEYCSKDKASFFATPKFSELSLSREQMFHNEEKHTKSMWFKHAGLGEDFAITRGFFGYAISSTGEGAFDGAKQDILAIKMLAKVRLEEIYALKMSLSRASSLALKSGL